MEQTKRILIVDDDPDFCAALARTLTRRGFNVDISNDCREALNATRLFKPDYAIVDLRLASDSGLKLIKPLLEVDESLSIVVLTGYGSIITAVEAIKAGARNYLTKPIDVDRLIEALSSEAQLPESGQLTQPISLKRLEWEHLHRVLAENHGNVSATARSLGMHRRTLQRKLQKHPVKK